MPIHSIVWIFLKLWEEQVIDWLVFVQLEGTQAWMLALHNHACGPFPYNLWASVTFGRIGTSDSI
jgi:hypothetical protein